MNVAIVSDVQLVDDDGCDFDAYSFPTNYLRRTISAFRASVMKSIDRADLNRRDATMFAKLLHASRISDEMTLSCLPLRRAAYRTLRETMLSAWLSPNPTTRRRWFFLTLFGDVGNALEYEPVVEIARFKKACCATLAKADLQTLVIMEVQAGTNFPGGGSGRTLMFHAHAIGFTDDPDYKYQDVAKRLNRLTRLTNALEARTVVMNPIGSKGELGRKCAYMLKAPIDGKYLAPSDNTKTQMHFHKSTVEHHLAVRLFEAMSLLTYSDVTWVVGKEAGALRTAWLRQLRAIHAQGVRRRLADDVHDVAALWERYWAGAHVKKPRRPFDIRNDMSLPPHDGWRVAFQRSMQSSSLKAL